MTHAAFVPASLLLLAVFVPGRGTSTPPTTKVVVRAELALATAREAYEDVLQSIRIELLNGLEAQRKRSPDPTLRAAAEADLRAFVEHGAWPRSIDVGATKTRLFHAKSTLQSALEAEAKRCRTKRDLDGQRSLRAECEQLLRINDLGGWSDVLDLARDTEPAGWARHTSSWKRGPLVDGVAAPQQLPFEGPPFGEYELELRCAGVRDAEQILLSIPDVDGSRLVFVQRVEKVPRCSQSVSPGLAPDPNFDRGPLDLWIRVADGGVLARLGGKSPARGEFQRTGGFDGVPASQGSTAIFVGTEVESGLELHAVRIRRIHRFDADFFDSEIESPAATKYADPNGLDVGRKFRGILTGNKEFSYPCDAVVSQVSKSEVQLTLTVHWTSGKGVLILDLNRSGKRLSMSKDIPLAAAHKSLRSVEAAKLNGSIVEDALTLSGKWYEKGYNGSKRDYGIEIDMRAQ